MKRSKAEIERDIDHNREVINGLIRLREQYDGFIRHYLNKLNEAKRELYCIEGKRYANGQRMYSDDGTMLNKRGTRSIFDDVDE